MQCLDPTCLRPGMWRTAVVSQVAEVMMWWWDDKPGVPCKLLMDLANGKRQWSIPKVAVQAHINPRWKNKKSKNCWFDNSKHLNAQKLSSEFPLWQKIRYDCKRQRSSINMADSRVASSMSCLWVVYRLICSNVKQHWTHLLIGWVTNWPVTTLGMAASRVSKFCTKLFWEKIMYFCVCPQQVHMWHRSPKPVTCRFCFFT